MADYANCSRRELDIAETEMKQTYERARAAFIPTAKERQEHEQAQPNDPQFYARIRHSLQNSQEAWVHYRNDFCATVEATYEGGTGASIAVPSCKKDLTVQRTEALNRWLGDWFKSAASEGKHSSGR